MWSAGVDGGPTPVPRAPELAASSLRLARSHYRALLSAVSVVLVPALVIGAVAFSFWRSQSSAHGSHSALAELFEFLGLVAVVLGSFFAQAAGVHAATSAVVGTAPDWRASCRAAYRRRGAVVGSSLAIGIVAGLGLLLFIVPGVVLWLTWFVAMPVVVLEGAGVRESLRRSAYLVSGRRLTILGAFLLVEIVVLVFSFPVGAIAGILFSHAGNAQVVAEQVAAYAVEVLLTPLQVALVLVVYLDLRLRRDGVTAAEIARGADIAAPTPSTDQGGSNDRGRSSVHGRSTDRGRSSDYGRYGDGSWEPSRPSSDSWTPTPPPFPEPVDQPTSGPGSPGWPAVSPKPSGSETVLPPSAPWPGLSPKPEPPNRRAAPPSRAADPEPSADEGSADGDEEVPGPPGA